MMAAAPALAGFGEPGFVTTVGVKTWKAFRSGGNQNFFKKIWRKEIFVYFCSVLQCTSKLIH